MADQILRDIQFRTQKRDASGAARMEIRSFNEQERKLRALKTLAMMWLIAAVCVLIPVAHFILVPGFLIAGVIMARRQWNTAEEGVLAEGECPACGKAIRIDLEKNADLPQWHDCPECGQALELRPGASS